MLLENTVSSTLTAWAATARTPPAGVRNARCRSTDHPGWRTWSTTSAATAFFISTWANLFCRRTLARNGRLRAKNPNCRIVISTNGIILNRMQAGGGLAREPHLFFHRGVDDDMLKKYEKRGSFEKAYENMKALVEYRNARGCRSHCWNGNIFCSIGTTDARPSNAR